MANMFYAIGLLRITIYAPNCMFLLFLNQLLNYFLIHLVSVRSIIVEYVSIKLKLNSVDSTALIYLFLSKKTEY